MEISYANDGFSNQQMTLGLINLCCLMVLFIPCVFPWRQIILKSFFCIFETFRRSGSGGLAITFF